MLKDHFNCIVIEAPIIKIKKDTEGINEFRLGLSPVDLGAGSSQAHELVESVRIMISDAENNTLLFEIDDLELTEVKLKDGVFTLTAVQKLYADIIYFQKAIEEGRLVKQTVRGTLS